MSERKTATCMICKKTVHIKNQAQETLWPCHQKCWDKQESKHQAAVGSSGKK